MKQRASQGNMQFLPQTIHTDFDQAVIQAISVEFNI